VFQITSLQAFSVNANDHDIDEDVDGMDFLIVQRNFGANQNGDADHNLVVDAIDLGMWASEFGFTAGPAPGMDAIPEPSPLMLLLAGCCWIISFVRHRGSAPLVDRCLINCECKR
jgi:hypothetical protein